MGETRWFCRSDEEWNTIAERLKHTPCPHCKVVGALIRHGCLYGFDDSSPQRKTVRARRVFCSSRNRRRGCGRTFSVWSARQNPTAKPDNPRGCGDSSNAPVADSIAAAIRVAKCHLSDRTLQRIWKQFDQGQSKIRTALSARCPPPELPTEPRPTDGGAFSPISKPPSPTPTVRLPLSNIRCEPFSCKPVFSSSDGPRIPLGRQTVSPSSPWMYAHSDRTEFSARFAAAGRSEIGTNGQQRKMS